ncbi:hypothetical protein HZA86_05350 [Candidatus Uhrbacteria bacterium]|nr:hypothetical protein [Candidatus Uhrbacteria bacterium]
MNRFHSGIIIGVVAITAPLLVWAQGTIIHPADQVHEGNYIRAAQSIQILGKVTKDVVVIGRDIVIDGPIEGDAIIVGQNVVIHSTIGGNVRILASTVLLDAAVAKNATMLAGNLGTTPTARVGWDLTVFADRADLQGTIDGWLWIRSRHVNLAATVGNDADVQTGSALSVAKNAQVKGTLKYSGKHTAAIAEGSSLGNVEYRQAGAKDNGRRSGRNRPPLFWPLVFLFGAWVVGGVLLVLAEPWLAQNARRLQQKPLATIGWGVVGLVVAPVLIMILAVTLIGIPLAVLLTMFYGMLVYCARVIIGYSLASIIQTRTNSKLPPMALMVVGIAAYVLLIRLPLIGPVLGLLGTVLAFGLVIQTVTKRYEH